MVKKIVWESQHLDEDEDEDVGYSDDDEMEIGKVMSTPFGVFRVDDSLSNPYKQFSIWMGHTNFLLTDEVVDKISKVPGVEVLKVISPYRFIVAPGKLFDWKDVAKLIQSKVCVNQYSKVLETLEGTLKTKVETHIKVNGNSEFWRLYIFPNEEVYSKVYDNMADYSAGKNEFAELKRDSNGIIISSD